MADTSHTIRSMQGADSEHQLTTDSTRNGNDGDNTPVLETRDVFFGYTEEKSLQHVCVLFYSSP